MRKITAALFTVAFTLSIAGAATACPYSKQSDETKKESLAS